MNQAPMPFRLDDLRESRTGIPDICPPDVPVITSLRQLTAMI